MKERILTTVEAKEQESIVMNGSEKERRNAFYILATFEGYRALGYKDGKDWARQTHGQMANEVIKQMKVASMEVSLLGAQNAGTITTAVMLELIKLADDYKALIVLDDLKAEGREINLKNTKRSAEKLFPELFKKNRAVSADERSRRNSEKLVDNIINQIGDLTNKQAVIVAGSLLHHIGTEIDTQSRYCIVMIGELEKKIEMLHSQVDTFSEAIKEGISIAGDSQLGDESPYFNLDVRTET